MSSQLPKDLHIEHDNNEGILKFRHKEGLGVLKFFHDTQGGKTPYGYWLHSKPYESESAHPLSSRIEHHAGGQYNPQSHPTVWERTQWLIRKRRNNHPDYKEAMQRLCAELHEALTKEANDVVEASDALMDLYKSNGDKKIWYIEIVQTFKELYPDATPEAEDEHGEVAKNFKARFPGLALRDEKIVYALVDDDKMFAMRYGNGEYATDIPEEGRSFASDSSSSHSSHSGNEGN